MTSIDDVLAFWFGDSDAPRDEWFRKDPAFDDAIRQRFGTLIDAALAGHCEGWRASPEGALAYILVLDQFTRNVHRGTARAFAGDPQAFEAARAMVAAGDDQALSPLRRVFVYMPFEHAEDLAAQDEAVRLFERLGNDDFTEWARKHREVIARFGRFPHRNEMLGRASTAEEEAFLREPGSRF